MGQVDDFPRTLVDGNTVGARTAPESTISALPAKLLIVAHYSRPAAVAFIQEKTDECRQLLNITRGMLLGEKRIADVNQMFLVLAALVIPWANSAT